MAATLHVPDWGALPLGALLGGGLGTALGLRPALLVGAAGTLLAALWLLAPAIRALRAAPVSTGGTDRSAAEPGPPG